MQYGNDTRTVLIAVVVIAVGISVQKKNVADKKYKQSVGVALKL
jgi:hypothetical protein